MVTEKQLIELKQADYEALESQRQQITRPKTVAELYAEGAAPDQRSYDNAINRIGGYEQALEQIDHELVDLEDWLINHNAPGWVSS